MIVLSLLPTSTAAGQNGPAKDLPQPPTGHAPSITVVGQRVIPQVVSTFPAQNAKVAPGLLILRVTYNTHMTAESWSYVPQTGIDYPDCASAPRLLDDKESFVLICRTLPEKHYTVWFNRAPMSDFASSGRLSAKPYRLNFTTTSDDPVRTLADAMKADPALSTVANPVEPDGLAAYGSPDGPG
jgi:hypothetical protein